MGVRIIGMKLKGNYRLSGGFTGTITSYIDDDKDIFTFKFPHSKAIEELLERGAILTFEVMMDKSDKIVEAK